MHKLNHSNTTEFQGNLTSGKKNNDIIWHYMTSWIDKASLTQSLTITRGKKIKTQKSYRCMTKNTIHRSKKRKSKK